MTVSACSINNYNLLKTACMFAILQTLIPTLASFDLTGLRGKNISYSENKGNENILNVVTLGGSVTWGSKGVLGKSTLQQLVKPYPSLLNETYHVDNLAMKETGADYPRYCTQSLLGETAYDVIILEFSINGIRGLEVLLERLRHRFPDAIIIYVDLYSLQAEAIDAKSRKTAQMLDTRKVVGYEWVWGPKSRDHNTRFQFFFQKLMKSFGGYVYALPRPENPADSVIMFAEDWHHLNRRGHAVVAEGITKLINSIYSDGRISKPARLNPWVDGDICDNWLLTGKTQLPFYGDVKMSQTRYSKHALEFYGVGKIRVVNPLEHRVTLYFALMAKGQRYPLTNVQVSANRTILIRPRYGADVPIVRYERVGAMEPGENEVTIIPDISSSPMNWPFRLTGIILCGECNKYQHELNKKWQADSNLGLEY